MTKTKAAVLATVTVVGLLGLVTVGLAFPKVILVAGLVLLGGSALVGLWALIYDGLLNGVRPHSYDPDNWMGPR